MLETGVTDRLKGSVGRLEVGSGVGVGYGDDEEAGHFHDRGPFILSMRRRGEDAC